MTFLKITLHTSCLSGLWLIYFYNSIFLPLTRLLCYFCTDSQTATAASLKVDRNSVGLTGLISIYGSLLKSVGHAYYYARALPDHLCTVITPFDTCTVTSVKWKLFTIILYLFFWKYTYLCTWRGLWLRKEVNQFRTDVAVREVEHALQSQQHKILLLFSVSANRNNGEVQLLLNWLTSPEGSTLASSSHLEKQMESLTAQRAIKPI